MQQSSPVRKGSLDSPVKKSPLQKGLTTNADSEPLEVKRSNTLAVTKNPSSPAKTYFLKINE